MMILLEYRQVSVGIMGFTSRAAASRRGALNSPGGANTAFEIIR